MMTYSRSRPFGSYHSDNPSDMTYRTDSNRSFRKLERMYASPSLDRITSLERSRSGLTSRQKSLYDLSNNSDLSSVSISSHISHRNPTYQKVRNSLHALNKMSVPLSMHSMNGHVSFNDNYMKSASHSPTPPRYGDSSPKVDRRDFLIGHLSASSPSPTMSRRVKPILSNRSNLSGIRQQWHHNSSTNDVYRPRVRERPLLSKISTILQSRPKSPLISSGISSPSPTKFDETLTPERRDSSSGIYRNRYVIKFREHNLGQTPSQRRSSITWDLPTTFTNVKTPEQLPISEQSELNQDQEKGVSLDSKCKTEKQEDTTSDALNKTQNLHIIQKEIKNEEMKEKLISDKEILEKTVSYKIELGYSASHKVNEMVPIQTVSNLPKSEPSGTQSGITPEKENEALKAKDLKVKGVNGKAKSPKKKKVKKKDIIKDQTQEEDKQGNDMKTEKIGAKIDEKVVQKVELPVLKDVNDNFINKVDLKQKEIIDNTPKRIKFRKYTFDDFNLLKVLGRGSFGKVFLAELKDHGVYFAIKCLKKHTVIEDDDVDSIMIERKILAYGSSHPFICKLFCTFQSECYLCFAMEWCCGGDLMFHVQKLGKFDEEKARFYASEILCALQFMHKKGIIYRDLKLDNIMVDKEGHVRLVDFGMCQGIVQNLHKVFLKPQRKFHSITGQIYREELLPSNFCGTPEYMAPEIIKGVQYNQSVDFWSLGIVIYEMAVGTSPFHGTDEDELLWNVCHEEVIYPRYLSENVKNVIFWLLKKTPEQRLGMATCPAGDIYSQPFFASVEWKKVAKCQIKPPFVPELSSPFDVSYFDLYFTKEEPTLTPVDKEIIESMDQKVFKGFSYTNHHMTD